VDAGPVGTSSTGHQWHQAGRLCSYTEEEAVCERLAQGLAFTFRATGSLPQSCVGDGKHDILLF
jgi:hypothetical protein